MQYIYKSISGEYFPGETNFLAIRLDAGGRAKADDNLCEEKGIVKF